jgi:hypothetical protein
MKRGETSHDGEPQLAVSLTLQGPPGSRPVGQPVGVGIEVRNLTTEKVQMVGVIDGSEEGVRYPHYQPSVSRNGVVMAGPPSPEDPLVGPLREMDFRQLDPGEAFDPTLGTNGAAYMPIFTFASFSPTEPGVYAYTLTLSTESDRPEDWLGRFGQQEAEQAAVLRRVAQVPRVTTTSNALEVEVR